MDWGEGGVDLLELKDFIFWWEDGDSIGEQCVLFGERLLRQHSFSGQRKERSSVRFVKMQSDIEAQYELLDLQDKKNEIE